MKVIETRLYPSEAESLKELKKEFLETISNNAACLQEAQSSSDDSEAEAIAEVDSEEEEDDDSDKTSNKLGRSSRLSS